MGDMKVASDLVQWLKDQQGEKARERPVSPPFVRPGNSAAIPLNLRALRRAESLRDANPADYYVPRHQPLPDEEPPATPPQRARLRQAGTDGTHSPQRLSGS
eukprot:Hpha_TRINITY_DN7138_c0_g1::TRINITY_DN7138_c0_g1_i1::g.29927::m.29927